MSNTLSKGGIVKRQVFGILVALVLVLSFALTVPVSSNSGLPVFVDIKPMSCPNPLNVRSGGALPVAILGTEDFDVMMIDPETITLDLEFNVGPLRWAYEDVATPYLPDLNGCHDLGADGYLDLVLKFDVREVVDAYLSGVEDGAEMHLQIHGLLLDGSLIGGEDTIVVIDKMRNQDG
jgi:hypothetical protein